MYACLLTLFLIGLRILVVEHPRPVHPDEEAFIAGIGFPAEYPVHPPGYALWVAMGTAAARMGVEPYWAYAGWSLATSIVGPVLAFFLLRKFVEETAALLWAGAYGASPLMWFSSVTALTYCAAAAIAVAVVLLCVIGMERCRPRWIFAAAALLSIGLLLRADLAVYAGPVVAYAAWRMRRPMAVIRAAAILVTGAAVLLVTMQFLYGRIDGDVASRLEHTREVLLGQSVFRAGLAEGLARNGVKVVVNLAWGAGVLPIVLIGALFLGRLGREEYAFRDMERRVVFWWLVPGIAFLLCFHVVQGYFLPLTAGLFMAVALMVERWRGRRIALYAASIALCLTVAQFVFYPWSAQSTGWKRTLDAKITFMSRAGMKQIDQRARIHEDGDFWRTPAHDLGQE